MEIQNTLENKAKFFSQHLGSDIYCNDKNRFTDEVYDILQCIRINGVLEGKRYCPPIERTQLLLKPISLITDEEAKKLGFRDRDHFNLDANPDAWKDELRLFGYATDWVNLTIEMQIKYGWIKLKSE